MTPTEHKRTARWVFGVSEEARRIRIRYQRDRQAAYQRKVWAHVLALFLASLATIGALVAISHGWV